MHCALVLLNRVNAIARYNSGAAAYLQGYGKRLPQRYLRTALDCRGGEVCKESQSAVVVTTVVVYVAPPNSTRSIIAPSWKRPRLWSGAPIDRRLGSLFLRRTKQGQGRPATRLTHRRYAFKSLQRTWKLDHGPRRALSDSNGPSVLNAHLDLTIAATDPGRKMGGGEQRTANACGSSANGIDGTTKNPGETKE
jgi:hypothetical protein